MPNDTHVQHQVSAEFTDSPTLGDLQDAVTRIRDAGAPLDAELVLTMGDKGNQRDPWPYVRRVTAKWGDR